jgi:DNA-binding transcriptional regulator YiaG
MPTATRKPKPGARSNRDGADRLLELFRTWSAKNPLRKFREANGYRLSETASMLSVSIGTIQQWEDGTREPKEERLNDICRLINRGRPQDALEEWKKWREAKPQL